MSGHLDGPPPGPPDPPYIPGDMGAPSAEEFAHKRGVGSGDELVTDYISGDAASLRFVERMTPEERARFDEQIDAAFADPPRNPYHAGLPHGLQLAQAWGRGFAAARVSTEGPAGSDPENPYASDTLREREAVCRACGGSGHRNGSLRAADPFGTCPGCDGRGIREAVSPSPPEPAPDVNAIIDRLRREAWVPTDASGLPPEQMTRLADAVAAVREAAAPSPPDTDERLIDAAYDRRGTSDE